MNLCHLLYDPPLSSARVSSPISDAGRAACKGLKNIDSFESGSRKPRVLPGANACGCYVPHFPMSACRFFLHFVSFRISVAVNRLQPFRKFFPTGHLKRNGPWARNEMALPKRAGKPPEGSRRNLRDTGAEKIVGRSGMASGKKNLRATWRAPVLPAVRGSGGCRRMSPCPETPGPFCGSGPAGRGVDQGTRFYRSRPVRRGNTIVAGAGPCADGAGDGHGCCALHPAARSPGWAAPRVYCC